MKKIFSLFVAALFSVAMMAATYSVAGSTAILGEEWAEKSTANEMVLVEDLYTLVKSDMMVGAGTYEYKVVKDHNWDSGAWPGSNAQLKIDKDGEYDITFTFNESTKAVNASAEYKGGAEIEKHPLVVGEEAVVNGAGWSNDNTDNLMTTTDEGLTYKLTITDLTLPAKSYEYKIVEKGTWTAYFDDGKGGNAKFKIEETGIYTIEYVYKVAEDTCVVTATKTGSAEVEEAYYLVGSKKGWEAAEANKLVANPLLEGEFGISTTLVEDETIKVGKAVNGEITTWYPDGMGTEYKVDAAHAGEEKVIYFRPAGNAEWEEFHQGGFFYIEANEEPVQYEDLKLVPGVWVDGSNAKIAAWVWGESLSGAWTEFIAGEADTLTVKINAAADSIIFVRFKPEATEPTWDGGEGYIWNKLSDTKIDHEGLTFTITAYDQGQWEPYVPAPVEKKELKLVPGIWSADDAKMAAWIWGAELDGKWTEFFAGTGDTLKVEIEATADSIIFARFKPEAEAPSWAEEESIRWNSTGSYKIDYEGLTFTITDWWKGQWEAVEPAKFEDGYYLIGRINGVDGWDIEGLNKDMLFMANPGNEDEFILRTTLAENDEIQVVRCDNDELGTWYPGGENANYLVHAEHAGNVVIYFRPDRQGGEDWHQKCFIVLIDSETAIDNTAVEGKAVKMIENGMLIIRRDGKNYNVLGTMVK